MCTEYNRPHVFDLPMPSTLYSERVQTLTGWQLCLYPVRNREGTKRTRGQHVTFVLCSRGPLPQNDLSLSYRQMVMVMASFQGNWRIVISSSFHLQYYTILHNMYIQRNPANFHFSNRAPDYILLFLFPSLLCVSLLFYGSLHPDLPFSLFVNLCVFVAASVSHLGLCFSAFVFPYIPYYLSFSMFGYPL